MYYYYFVNLTLNSIFLWLYLCININIFFIFETLNRVKDTDAEPYAEQTYFTPELILRTHRARTTSKLFRQHQNRARASLEYIRLLVVLLPFNSRNGVWRGCRCCGSQNNEVTLYSEGTESLRTERSGHTGGFVSRGTAEQEAGVRGVSWDGGQRGKDAGDSGGRTDGDQSKQNRWYRSTGVMPNTGTAILKAN